MKRIAIIILLCTGLANAQNVVNPDSSNNRSAVTNNFTKKVETNNKVNPFFKTPEHYRETSKVAFYETLLAKNNFKIELKECKKVAFFEALISKNNFDIELKNTGVAIKNTEEMVYSLKNRTLVASK